MKLTEIAASASTVSAKDWKYISLVNEWMAEQKNNRESKISSFYIRKDGRVDVNGSIIFNTTVPFTEKKLPFPFGKVKGTFYLTYSDTLETLENFPEEVTGSFSIGKCPKINTLKHMPKILGEFFSASNTSIQTLAHLPKIIGKDLNVVNLPKLTTMEGISDIVKGDLVIYGLPKLKKFTFPKEVHGIVTFDRDFGSAVNFLNAFNIKGIKEFEFRQNSKVAAIFNKYYPKKDMLNCQDELIEAGLEEYAEVD